MEKTVIGGAMAAVVGWLGLLQGKKVDRSTCDAKHEGLCEKIDLLTKRQEYMIERLDRHLDGNG